MKKTFFCPECLSFEDFNEVLIEESFDIKGESIQVCSRYFQCESCEENILNPDSEDENFTNAYNEYRKLKNLLLPEEIISVREKYNLSQRQLAKILGWSHATLSRYESGALQSVSHNNELVLINDPDNMLKILKRNKERLSKSDYEQMHTQVSYVLNSQENKSMYKMIEKSLTVEPSEFTGYKKFELEKLLRIIRFFVSKDHSVFKVKLFKYLWYTDFLSFKKYTVSQTGLRYSKLPMGPVPDNYDLLLSLVLNEGNGIKREFVHFGYSNPGERFYIEDELDLSSYSEEELEILEQVYEVVSPHNSTSISDFSHKEIGWLETNDRELISYKYASELNV